ncbi:MAG: dTMP kinase [Alphaproteobacteria bacterium]|nr:dTMP kinase [Alphaproteobacteria bacterium]
MSKGFFITFEGGEGSGKTTQSELLYNNLKQKGLNVTRTREPGGTILAESIREILLKGEKDKMSSLTELYLFSAARRDHIDNVIAPSLKNNEIVICDRFIDSTTAYQGYAGNIDLNLINSINNFTIGSIIPNITYIFDIDPNIGLKRSINTTSEEIRFEEKDIGYHKKIRSGFLEIAKNNSDRCIVIDAEQELKKIEELLLNLTIKKYEDNGN